MKVEIRSQRTEIVHPHMPPFRWLGAGLGGGPELFSSAAAEGSAPDFGNVFDRGPEASANVARAEARRARRQARWDLQHGGCDGR